jgi:hypothetical protein
MTQSGACFLAAVDGANRPELKAMVEKMDELPLQELEAVALKWVRAEQGCDHVEAVNINRLDVQGTAPNWDAVEFIPPLDPLAEAYARNAINRLRQTYALAEEQY